MTENGCDPEWPISDRINKWAIFELSQIGGEMPKWPIFLFQMEKWAILGFFRDLRSLGSLVHQDGPIIFSFFEMGHFRVNIFFKTIYSP